MSHQGWEVYVITRQRTGDIVWRFVAQFVDRVAAEDRGDEQMMMDRLDVDYDDMSVFVPAKRGDVAAWLEASADWEPAISLTHMVGRGLSQPWRSFMIYTLPTTRPELLSLTLGFTSDGGVILGVETATRDEAALWLRRLADDFEADLGLVTSGAAPSSFADAEKLIARGNAHLHWRRPSTSPPTASPTRLS